MDYTSLIRESKQFCHMIDNFGQNRLSHAYLLKSEDTDFADNFCYELAAEILQTKTSILKKGSHPDCQVVGETGKISVENINQIIENLAVRPYSANKKVYIILGADNMNEQSQNKILKSLEEPPKDVIFILSAKSTKTLLQTILSRVTTIELAKIESEKIFDLLTNSGVSREDAEVAVAVCHGNSTLATKLVNQKFILEYNLIFEILKNLNGSKDCLFYASKIDIKQTDMAEFIDTLELIIRDVSMVLSGAENLIYNKHKMQDIKTIANCFNLNACVNLLDECNKLKEDLFYNTNNLAVLDKLLFKIAEEKAKCKK